MTTNRTRVPIAADWLEARLVYALRLAAGMPQVIIVKNQAEKRQALGFLNGKPGAEALQIETHAENEARHRQRSR